MIVFPSMMINAQFPTLDFRVYHGVPHEDGRICRGEDPKPRDWVQRAFSVTQMATLGQVIVFRLDRLVVSKCLWHFLTRTINLNWFIFFRWIETAKPPNFYGIFRGAQGPLIPILMVTSPIQLPSLRFRGFRNFHQPPSRFTIWMFRICTHTHIIHT